MIMRFAVAACEGDRDFRVNAGAALVFEIRGGCEGKAIGALGCIAGEIAATAVCIADAGGNCDPRGTFLFFEANGNRGGGFAEDSVEDMC